MSSATCKDCGAAVALLTKLISGAPVACEPASVRPGDRVYVRNLHKEHACAAPEKPTRQRGLFGGEE